MKQFFVYWVWPNPGGWHYDNPKIMVLIGVAVALIFLSILLRVWRSKQTNSQTRTLSRSWSSASFWFGVVMVFLIVCRVELIQFLAMRFLWVLFALSVGMYFLFQIAQFRRRHYTVLNRTQVLDERDKYLPRKK